MLAVVAVLASVGCWCLAAQARSDGKRFTLGGTVVDSAGGRPLADVELSLQTEKWQPAGDPVLSDAQGRFAFPGLAAGEYILSATGSGFGTILYGEAPDPGWVHAVHVGADKSIVFPIVPRGTIEGVVRDEFGDPMMRAEVTAMRPLWSDGRAALRSVGQKFTDDRGRYRFANLAPGSYVVCSNGSQTGSAPAPVQGPVDFAARVDRFYTRACYPASPRTYQLAAGQRAQIDLAPLPASAATVRGRVRNAPSQMGMQPPVVLEGSPESGQAMRTFLDPTGGFVFRGVAPGSYLVRFIHSYAEPDGSQELLIAEAPVDVAGADVDGLDVTLEPAGSVEVAVHGPADGHLDLAAVNVGLRRSDFHPPPFKEPPDESGSPHFQGLSPGRYWLTTRTAEESCVQSVKLGGREVRGKPLEVAVGAALHVDVTVSAKCGGIRARAVRDGQGIAGAKVVLLLSGTAQDPGDLMEDFANDEGELSFFGLAPGRYLLWAWAVEGKGAIAGPLSLAAVAPEAAVVEVKEGETIPVDVPLLKDEGQAK